jgi:hypothetical protein
VSLSEKDGLGRAGPDSTDKAATRTSAKLSQGEVVEKGQDKPATSEESNGAKPSVKEAALQQTTQSKQDTEIATMPLASTASLASKVLLERSQEAAMVASRMVVAAEHIHKSVADDAARRNDALATEKEMHHLAQGDDAEGDQVCLCVCGECRVLPVVRRCEGVLLMRCTP